MVKTIKEKIKKFLVAVWESIVFASFIYLIYFCIKGGIVAFATALYVLSKFGYDVTSIIGIVAWHIYLLCGAIIIVSVWFSINSIKAYNKKNNKEEE